MKNIAIYGAGGLGREILMLVRQINLDNPAWNIRGFFDDSLAEGHIIGDIPVLGNMDSLNAWNTELYLVIAIGSPSLKKQVYQGINNSNVRYATLVHPMVQIEGFQNVIIGEGSIIAAGNIFTTDIRIGKHVLINLDCTIGHDVDIKDYASLMPGCHVSGEVRIGKGCYLGSGSVVINKVEIGESATIGAGAVVINNAAANAISVGVPAREIIK